MRSIRYWPLWLFWCCFASLGEPIPLSQSLINQGLTGYAEVLEDETGQLTFSDIQQPQYQAQFQAFTPADINRGITRSHYWLKFAIRNDSQTPLVWVLTPETSYIDDLDLYVGHNGSWVHQHRSDQQPFSMRDLSYRLLNFRVNIGPNEQQYGYLKISNRTLETVSIQTYISEQSAFSDYLIKENLLFGVYYGLFFGMAIFAFSLWLYSGVRTSPYYGYFFIYLSWSMLMWGSLNGFNFQFLWPNHPWLFNQTFHLIYLLVAIFAFQFSRHLLGTKTLVPKLDKLLLALIGIYCGAFVLRLFGEYELVLYVSFFSLLSMAINPIVGWLCYRQGNRYVIFYIAAWVPYSLSLVVSLTSASSDGWSRFGMSTLHLTQVAVLFECIMLILAMLTKMRHSSHQLQAEAELSMVDPLTQLKNRRFIEQCTEEFKHAKEQHVELWVLLIDLDYFKRVNDEHGHAVGDQILVELAQILKSECRSVDVAARWGGEEFIIISTVVNHQMAHIVAERIRRLFANRTSQIGNKDIAHTLSIGLAQWHIDHNQEFAECLQQADQALYQAKQNGRDQVVSYNGIKLTANSPQTKTP
ncbi:GGDEF domain-containing protein [Neiella sp. HB171785]|uniref:diguanylate cyclase n=1 Tax=Neiella litorisoli TaxID=2771431 RepID=A0A8J6UHX6_9GAMM|nr:diguanylate cyclase [Neiella litorisoli]MBD1387843.1 GGDEF domain-containing protein [Neiella litorisoli]